MGNVHCLLSTYLKRERVSQETENFTLAEEAPPLE